MSVRGVYSEYVKDVEKYLKSKLPDVPVHTIMEISEYLGAKSVVLVNDLWHEQSKSERSEIYRRYKQYVNETKDKLDL